MISDSEKLKANEYLDRKKIRLQQVREQSKSIAKNIRSRVQEEKNRQLRVIGSIKKKEFENAKRKTIEKLQKDHLSCLSEIGASHNAASEEVAAEQEWKVQKEVNAIKAFTRGSSAAGALRTTKIQQEQEGRNAAERRGKARSITDRILANIRKKSPSSNTSRPSERKIHHYYLENEDQDDNECSNLTENFEITQIPHLNNLMGNTADSLENFNEENLKSSFSNKCKPISGLAGAKNIEKLTLSAKSMHENDNILHSDHKDSGWNHQIISNEYDSQQNAANENDKFMNENPSVYRLNPTETLRQIANEYRLTQEPTVDFQSHLQSLRGYDLNRIDEMPTQLSRNILQRSPVMSCDKPLNIISQHIQNRNLTCSSRSNCPAYNKLAVETEVVSDPSMYAAERDTIKHARRAPYVDSANIAPIIPSLPEYYKKQNLDSAQRDIIENAARKKSADLSSDDVNWVPKSTEPYSTDGLKRKYTTLSPRLYNHGVITRGGAKPLRGILAKCAPSKNVARKPKLISSTKDDMQGHGRESGRSVRCYDHTNKFAKNVTFDSRKLVERTPRKGADAYRSAREEDLEEERLIADMKSCKNVTASRLRGENALEKMKFNNEIKKMRKEIQQLKNERLFRSHLPETIYIEECPLEHEKRIRKTEERRKDDKIKKESADKKKLKSPDVKKINKVSVEEDHTSKRAPVSESLKRGENLLSDDLDEIPTKESESSSRSTAVRPIPKITPDEVKKLNAEDLLQLVKRQKKRLMKEVAMIGLPANSISPSDGSEKVFPESRAIFGEDSSDSTLDGAPPEVCNKRFTKRINVASPKSKNRLNKLDVASPKSKNRFNKLDHRGNDSKSAVDKSKYNKEVSQSSSSTVSSVSFEGLQIVVQIKKDNKKLEKKAIERIGTEENMRECIDSPNEVSIKASKYVAKKEVRVEENTRYNTSESTAYMSPPEKITTHFEKILDHKFSAQNNVRVWDDFPSTAAKNNIHHWVSAAENQSRQHHPGEVTVEDKLPEDKITHRTRSVSTYTRDDKVTRVESKGVQVKIMSEIQKSSVIVGENVSKTSTIDINPMLKKYIRQLLEMSKSGIDSLGIDVSDISTPGSSVINIPSNVLADQNDKASALHEKVEKLRHFIQENYSLLDELGKENIFSSSSNGVKKIRDKFRASSDDMLSSLAASSSENIQKSKICQVLPQESTKKPAEKKVSAVSESKSEPSIKKSEVNTAKIKKSTKTVRATPDVERNADGLEKFPPAKTKVKIPHSQIFHDDKKMPDAIVDQSVPKKGFVYFNTKESENLPPIPCESNITDSQAVVDEFKPEIPESATDTEMLIDLNPDPGEILTTSNTNINVMKNITMGQSNNEIDECTQRISNLSEMLTQVRKDKEAMLSSSASPLNEEKVIELSQKLSSNSSNESEKNTTADVPFVPMFSDIPKPQSDDYTRSSQIDRLRKEILSVSERTDTFIPMVWDCKLVPEGMKNFSDTSQFLSLGSFVNSELQQLNNRRKPPVALGRHSIMRNNNVDPGTPHELSTIAEVDTPITARNASAQSQVAPFEIQEIKSPIDRNKMISTNSDSAIENVGKLSTTATKNITDQENIVNPSNPFLNYKIDTGIDFKPFISFYEYVTKNYPGEEDVEITLESTLKPENVEDLNLWSSDETLPDIISEMLKRNLITKPFSSHNSTTHGSAEDSSSSSKSKSALLALSPSKSPLKDSQRRKKQHDPSMSGVQVLQNTSSDSEKSSDLEAALEAGGMGWAVTLLKRTERAFLLSSGSSSPKNKHSFVEKKYNVVPEDPGNVSNVSIGLSTLKDDLNLDDDFWKDYSPGHISKSSTHRELEMLFKKIENIKMKEKERSEGSLRFLSPFSTLTAEELLSHKKIDEKSVKSLETNTKEHIQSKPDDGDTSKDKDKTHQRTSTPVLTALKSPSFSSNGTSSSHGASKGLFGIESDLSSVRNVSNSDRNLSLDEKDNLSIPNLSLKFGKLFDSTVFSDN